MTNKYQEALELVNMGFVQCPSSTTEGKDRLFSTIREALQAGAEGRILPKLDGWKLVPIEPTKEIENAMMVASGILMGDSITKVYTAMINAAPNY